MGEKHAMVKITQYNNLTLSSCRNSIYM